VALRRRLLALLEPHEWGLLLAIVIVVGVTTVVDQHHTYLYDPGRSLHDICRQASMLGIFALGSALVIITGGIDLSAGSVIAFSGTICGSIMLLLAPEAMESGEPLGTPVIVAAIGGTTLVGFFIGTLHAWLITEVGLPPFVATLASLVGLRSLGRAMTEYLAHSTQIQIFDTQFRDLTKSVALQGVLFILLAAAMWILLSRTVVGRHLYALGGNEEAARLSGIRTNRLKWLAYSIAAMLSSLAGILYIGDQGVVDPQTLGRAYELNAIAAAVVGGCSLQGGVGTILGTVLGCLFLRLVIDGVAKMIHSGADVYEGLIVGILVVLAVAFNELRRARDTRKQFFSGALGIAAGTVLVLFGGIVAALLAGTQGGATPRSMFTGLAVAVVVLLAIVVVHRYERRPKHGG